MKNKIAFIVVLLSISGLFAQTATCDGTLPFEEQNGLLTIEMESGIINDNRWQIDTETVDGEDITYLYWTGEQSFNALSNAPIVYNIKINNPGTYRFAWRMRVGLGTSPGEHNDAWLKINGEDFYGIKSGAKVYPKPMCENDANLTCAEGSSTQNFIKAFGNRLDWWFVTNTNDGDSHRVWVTFNEAKEYKITVDARSSYLFIDKMVLHRNSVSSTTAFNLSNPESSCYNALSTTKNKLVNIKIYPNPTKHLVHFDNLPENITLTLTNILGATVKKVYTTSKKETINISNLKKGVYFITSNASNSNFVKKIIKL
ncbi:T9SS type A sorting domain-containing protein [Algibacter sp. PT7-4]|uniref:T9SS type A sorting domain-containing protein n=1 Tax=Algibacter ulvanivorans TaxID=3400999 RepID=UPI003AAED5CF